jgi:hypothetical protein
MSKRKNRVIAFLLIGALSLLLKASQAPVLAQAKPPNQAPAPSTPTTGQRIGQIVKDAIGTAFPGVAGIGGLIDAIWAKKSNSGGNVNKNQLTQAATSAQDDIKKQIVAQAQQKLIPLAEVADELQIVSQFGVPTVTASENVVRMSERLKSGKTLGEDDWKLQQEDWEVAKGELQAIKNVTDLSKVQDLWLRDKLSKIQQANITAVTRIEIELKSKSPNIGRLSQQLDDLYATLKDISAAIGYEVSNMQGDVKGLSDWAKGAAGAEENALSPEEKRYMNFLNGRYK